LASRFFGRLNLAEFIGLAAVLAVGFWLTGSGTVTVGAVAAAALYFHRLFDPINVLLGLFGTAQEAAAGLARLVGVAHLPKPSTPAEPARPVDAAVRLADVDFDYSPDRPVLRDVDLDIACGEHVAVIGPSGAGKTTLAKLVAGIHAATRGRTTIGGAAVESIDPGELRRSVALVTQEVHVFAGPLADDLRLAKPDASDEELRSTLDRVGATSWVETLPDGLAAVVGEGGQSLTATQAQQLALARLLLADPAVAILDEATADAGSAGARQLDRAAAVALAGRTALIVAHRLSQAATADRIVVLRAGRIVEQGTHTELLALDGEYTRLWQSWSSATSN
jgi:ATP-binding cassette subfamily C protein